ncbi:hypothetical protein JKP88DRAFT_171360 [Tribonema minus]|uniref:EF-hand domain-containing protein n=1 Tax=Tribonema minus TaxID=303371 RepID=A0A835YTH5_9STRA|nr:hypothetical protein JKP88DRAFT_171360 [Tribonema minus]
MFNDIDLDGSGTVDCDEFLLLMIILKYCLFNKEQILAFCFRMYDTDGSGSIDEQEFMDLLHTVNNASPIFPGNFQRALDEFDVNKDGLIDFDEFRELDKR